MNHLHTILLNQKTEDAVVVVVVVYHNAYAQH